MRIPLLTLLALPAPALADPCTEEIAAMFRGGALDPFARPAHRQLREVYGEDGALDSTFEALIETPTQIVSGVVGSGNYMLMQGRETWIGPTMDGPWSPSGMTITEDVAAAQAAVPESQAANLTGAECLGETEVEGRAAIAYRFTTRVDPHPARGNSWWGSRDTVYLDPDTGLPFRWEATDHQSSWAQGLSRELHVTTIEYDASIDVEAPR